MSEDTPPGTDPSLTRWKDLATLPSTNFKMVSGTLLSWLTGGVYLTLVVLGRDAGMNGTAWDSWLIFLGAALGFSVGQYIGKRMTYASPSPDSERAGVPVDPPPAKPTDAPKAQQGVPPRLAIPTHATD
jgi:hypothetical protein